ncbi:MAG TPA: hypothetical protein VHZ02_04155 [Acidimicrobiales bacterium]|nr:hypothetical protein [Acidimicrobiales bacterium]
MPRRRPVPGAAAVAAALTMVIVGGSVLASVLATGLPAGAAASSSPWAGGFTAVAVPALVDQMKSASCADTGHCWAVGESVGQGATESPAAVIATTNGGKTWRSQAVPPGTGVLNDVSCADRQYCVAVGQSDQAPSGGSAVVVTTDGGASWKAAQPLAGVFDMTAVVCRANRHCWAVGTVAAGESVFASTPGTAGWRSVGNLPPGVSGASAISCSDDRHCWVTGYTTTDPLHVSGAVAATSNGGTTWVALPVPAGTGYLNGISCTQGPSGQGGSTTTTTHAHRPTASSRPTSPTAPTTVTTSVPAPSVAGASCVAVGTSAVAQGQTRTGHGVILASPNGGASWTTEPVPSVVATLFAVSCPSIGTCAAVGATSGATAQAGVSVLSGAGETPWQHPTVVTMPLAVSGVSCLSTSACAVVGGAYTAYLRS